MLVKPMLESARDRREAVSWRGPGETAPDPVMAPIEDALRALADLVDLAVHEDAGVHETLVASIYGDCGHAYLSVENALGARETVTTWGFGPHFADAIADWDRCRRTGAGGDHAWDLACRGARRTSVNDVRPMLIDRGAYAAMDALRDRGARTFVSCEGHPGGAYLGIEAADPAVEAVFHAQRWKVTRERGALYVYMEPGYGNPDWAADGSGMPVADVAERDRRWRTLVDALAR